jgi:hypothetical protein
LDAVAPLVFLAIENLKSKIATAPLAQLAEQLTLNSREGFCAVFRDVAQRVFQG